MILASRGFPFRGSEDVMSLPRPCLEGGTIALVAPGGKAKCQERRADTPSNQAGLPRRLIPGIWRGALLRWSLLLCPACTSVQPQGHGLASLAAAIFPTTVLKSLCDNDLLRPKIGFDLALSRHSGSSAEISDLPSPLSTRHSQRSVVFPPTSLSSPELPTALCPLTKGHPLPGENRVRSAARFRQETTLSRYREIA
jgi:hypothetical protein